MISGLAHHQTEEVQLTFLGMCKFDMLIKIIEHRHQINVFYSQTCDALQRSSSNCIPSSKPRDSHDYIVPGFNEYVKDVHCTARYDYVAWRDAGEQRSGVLCSDMRRSRLMFKYALRQCKSNEETI